MSSSSNPIEGITLKHLDFANNGLVKLTRLPHWEFKEVPLNQCTLSFNEGNPYLRHKDVTFGMDQIMVYKRPLSDLTKEIEVNGERVVPSDRYPELEISYHNCFCFFDGDRQNENIDDLPFHVFEWLVSIHFDVFGLIDKGLGININDIQK